jgi:hypothetical protein
LLDFSHILRLTIRAKESGRCLGLKFSPCKTTWRRRSGPIAPCCFRPLLPFAIVLFALVAFDCWGRGSTGKWCQSRLRDQVWDLRSQVGKQRSCTLVNCRRMRVVISCNSGNDEGGNPEWLPENFRSSDMGPRRDPWPKASWKPA